MTGDEVFDVFPIRDRYALKAKFSAQDVRQNKSIDVRGDSVHLATVHHDAHRSGLNRLGERR